MRITIQIELTPAEEKSMERAEAKRGEKFEQKLEREINRIIQEECVYGEDEEAEPGQEV